MDNKIKENIILPAWKIIQNDSRAKKAYFLPGLLSIIFLTVILVYQSVYTYVVIFNKKDKALEIILNFFHSDYIMEVMIASVIFLLIYIIIIPIFEGGLIKHIDSKNQGKETSFGDSLGLGVYRFFPLFEYNNIFSEFKFMSVLNGYLFVIRFVGVEYIKYVSYSFLVIFLFSIIINVLFAYSKYSIVIGNKKAFKAIGESSKIAILNFKTTTKLYFFMFVLNVRVIINFIIFLSFPIIMIIAVGLITSKIFLTIAITILSILFVCFILALGYLTAVLDIFKTAIWYFAYKEGKKKLIEIEEVDEEKK